MFMLLYWVFVEFRGIKLLTKDYRDFRIINRINAVVHYLWITD